MADLDLRIDAVLVFNSGFLQSMCMNRECAEAYVRTNLADSPEVEIIEVKLRPEQPAAPASPGIEQAERAKFDKWVKDNDMWSAMNSDAGGEEWAWTGWLARAQQGKP